MANEEQFQSNLANFLNDIHVTDPKRFQGFGDFLGAVADVGGAVGAVIAIVNLFISQPDPLQAIFDALRNAFEKLGAELKAENIITRRTNQVNVLGPALTVVGELNDFVNSHPTDVERLNKLDPCITAIHDLSPETPIWVAPFNDQIFWSDAGVHILPVLELKLPGPFGGPKPYLEQVPVDRGYGEQAPAANPDGTVFNHFYVLPAYCEAVFMYSAALTSLLPDFARRFPDQVKVLRNAADVLRARHDTIVSGITLISPGRWDRQKLLDALRSVFVPPFPGTAVAPGFTVLADGLDLANAIFAVIDLGFTSVVPNEVLHLLGGVKIEYGAVEKFSGCSAIAGYKLTFQQIDGMAASDASPFNKFQLRLARNAKDVYVKLGLPHVMEVINHLRDLAGDARLPRPDVGQWSFRKEIFGMAQIPSRPAGSFHLSDAARFIKDTVPDDTPRGAVTSFRALLV